MNDKFYSVFAEHLSGFVSMKRNLGFKYRAGEETLARFDRMACELDIDRPVVTKAVYDQWMGLSPNESELSRYSRAVCLKQFLSYLGNLGLKAYSAELPKYPGCRFIPHIYTIEEMERIFEACDGLRMRIRNPFSPIPSMPCLLRVLYATGIRIGEAISLPEKNVELNNNRILLEKTKNGKERLLPIDGSLASVCREYLDHKHRVLGLGRSAGSPFFTSLAGEGLKRGTVERRFGEILRKAGIPSRGARKGPRLHDIRHTFACHSFVRLADEGVDLYCSWPYLAAYLGHGSLESTERYVRLTANLYPDLLKDGHTMYMETIPNEKEAKYGKGI